MHYLLFLFSLLEVIKREQPANIRGLIIRNEFSIFCEVNNILFFNNRLLDFVHTSGNISSIKSDCKSMSVSKERFYKSFLKVDIQDQYYRKCLEKGEISISYSNYQECRMFDK